MTSKINEDVLEQIVIDMETENRTFTQIIKHYKTCRSYF
jgi:hypothetical protein